MALSTISGEPVTTVEDGSTFTLAVQTISGPDTSHTPATTLYIHQNGQTVQVYTTYTPNPGGGEPYAPSTVTETIPASKTNESDTTNSVTSKPKTTKPDSSTETSSSRTTEAGGTTASTSVEPDTTTGSAAAAPTNANNSSAAIESPSSNGNSGISDGALAGAIVGSIVGTALVVLLLAFIFFRRRRNQPSKEYELKPVAVLPKSSSSRYSSGKADGFALASIIPQPADDDTVRSRILAVIDQVNLHVDNYYAPGSTPIQLSHEQVALLERFDTGQLPAPILTLLAQRGVQRQLITHVLVYSLLRGIESGGELLPRELATQPQGSQPNAPDPIKALFTWRMLTAHLYANSSSSSRTGTGAGTDRTAANGISRAREFTDAFAPYSISSFSPSERIAHLESLTRLTTNLGIWLFGQPCEFEFAWNMEKKGRDEFLVQPRVVKVSDERGDMLDKALVLVEGVKAGGQGKA
ncbi:uncharacterized protein BDV14DRAFT_78404 [Aspergillus stella-maris]|uniref:uncharacterized protein n=1 Tax=Aspergillus stella-maris TaxID=1810926 RepID=UPI003CCD5021